MNRTLLFLCSFCYTFGLYAVQPLIDRISDRIARVSTYKGTIVFEVTQPMTDEEVRYRIGVNYSKQPVDTLCGYYYYLDVKAESNPDIAEDFIAYYGGHYLNFSNNKLREYHADENAEPFKTKVLGRRTLKGVHRSGIFADELPVEIGLQLRHYRDNPQVVLRQYENRINEGKAVDVIEAEEYDGEEIARFIRYVFDHEDSMPLYKQVETSPGHLASQTVTTRYLTYVANEPFPEDYFTEERLIREKGRVFAGNRDHIYRLRNMKGKKAPDFVLPLYGRNDSLCLSDLQGQPVILAFLNPSGGFCHETADLLNRMSRLPVHIVAIFSGHPSEKGRAFIARHDPSFPVLKEKEEVKALYGVTGYPSLFVLDARQVITSVYAGYEPGWEEKLISALPL